MPQSSTPTIPVPYHTITNHAILYHVQYQSKALMPPDHTGHLPALIVAHSLFDHTWSPSPSLQISGQNDAQLSSILPELIPTTSPRGTGNRMSKPQGVKGEQICPKKRCFIRHCWSNLCYPASCFAPLLHQLRGAGDGVSLLPGWWQKADGDEADDKKVRRRPSSLRTSPFHRNPADRSCPNRRSASYFQVFPLNCHFCRNLLLTSYFLRPYCAMPPKLPLKRRTIFYNEIFYSKPQSSRCWTAGGNDLLLLKINVKSGLGKMIAAGNNQTENWASSLDFPVICLIGRAIVDCTGKLRLWNNFLFGSIGSLILSFN